MYPYRTRWRWWLSNRFKHMVDGIDRARDLDLQKNRLLRNRIGQMRRWLLVRAIVLPFLFASAVSALVGAVMSALGVGAAASDALDAFQTVANTFTGLFAALWFFANRTMGQIDADLTLALTIGQRFSHDEE